MSAGRATLLVGTLLLAAGCRPLAKPAELTAFEQLRGRAELAQVLKEKEKGGLAAQSATEHRRAVEAWEERDLRAARHHALVGAVQLRTAAARREERALRAEIQGFWKRLNKVQAEEAGAKEQLAQLQEMVQLYEELAAAQSSALEKRLHLSEVQAQAQAERRLGQARLALKMAELVGGERYARKLTQQARTLVERAGKELAGKQATKGGATAGLALQKAQEAAAAARPRYLQERAAAERQAQNQALQRELTTLAAGSRWLSVKLEARGGAQQLVVPMLSLFLPLATKPLAAKRALLDKLAAGLKRFPDFHLVIRGHTSHRAPKSKRLQISRLRARSVADHLIAAGLTDKRLLVRGEGAARTIAHKRSSLNDRVELWILLR